MRLCPSACRWHFIYPMESKLLKHKMALNTVRMLNRKTRFKFLPLQNINIYNFSLQSIILLALHYYLVGCRSAHKRHTGITPNLLSAYIALVSQGKIEFSLKRIKMSTPIQIKVDKVGFNCSAIPMNAKK
ncbi:hypothetical protein FKM82_005671 [Ascaphus truei]